MFYIVLGTNVFSRDGVNDWNFLSFRSLCGSRLMNNQLTLLIFRCRMSKSNGLDNKGLFGSSPISLLGLPLLGGGASLVVFLIFHFLASASAALVFFCSEAGVGTLGFEPVMLAGKTMRGSSAV